MTHPFTGSPGHVGVSQVFSSLCEHFLTLWYQIRSSRIILYFCYPVLESAIFPNNHGSFQWRIVLETNIQVLGVLMDPGKSSQHTELGNTCVHTSICVYHIYVHGHAWVHIHPTMSSYSFKCNSSKQILLLFPFHVYKCPCR